jgi:hypothetical protein
MRNRNLIYFGSCIIAGLRLARASQVNTRVIPTIKAIEESVEMAEHIYDELKKRIPPEIGRRDTWGGR